MGLSALLSNGAKVQIIPPNGLPVFTVDSSDEELHELSSKPTNFEMENGQTLSDHIVLNPRKLTLTGTVTDAPLSLLGSLIGAGVSKALGAALPLLGPASAALSLLPSLGSSSSRSKSAFLSLVAIYYARLPVKIVTSLYVYRNMWITGVSVPRNNKTGQTLVFTATAQQLLLVSPQTVNIAKYSKADLAAAKAEEGQKATNPLTSAAQKAFNMGHSIATLGL